jgi:Fe-S-cluster containining protein
MANSVPYERKMRKIGGRCMFLQGAGCSIYESRPLICRFYPFCLRRAEDGEFRIGFDSACSGIGKGPVRDEEFFRNLLKLAERELADL